MKQRIFLILFLLCIGLAAAQPVVSSIETTNTQAVIRYTAPTDAACSWEVSEESDYSPVVHDVNNSLFAGAHLDSRSTSVNVGRQRVFVLGRRTIDMVTEGVYRNGYSRALQADTVHYYRVTCDGQTATGTFTTQTVPFGASYTDAYLYDDGWPGHSKLLYHDTDTPNYTVIDPFTGVQVRALDNATNWREGYVYSTHSVVSSGTWVNPANQSSATPGTYATCTDADCGLLIVEHAMVNQSYAAQMQYRSIRLRMTGLGDSATAADRQVEICLVRQGTGVCDDRTGAYKLLLTLNQSSETQVEIPEKHLFNANRTGIPWYVGGGSHYWLQIGIRKVTTSGTVSIRAVESAYEGFYPSNMGSSGAANRCSPNVRSDGYYLCSAMLEGQSANRFYLVHSETAHRIWLGRLEWLPDVGSTVCSPGNTNIPFHATNPNKFYCMTSQARVAEVTYVGTGTEKAAHYTWSLSTDYTIAWVTDATFTSKVQTFYNTHESEWHGLLGGSGRFNSFTTTKCGTCKLFQYVSGDTEDYILAQCNCGGDQDTPSWAIAVAVSTGNVIGMAPTFAAAPTRWCSNHTPELFDEPFWMATMKSIGYTATLAAPITSTGQSTITVTSSCTGECTNWQAGDPVNNALSLKSLMPWQVGDNIQIGSELLNINDTSAFPVLGVDRGIGGTTAATASTGATVTAKCSSWAGSTLEPSNDATGGYRLIWDFRNDPYGISTNGTGTWSNYYYGHPDGKYNRAMGFGRFNDNSFSWRNPSGQFFATVKSPLALAEPNALGIASGIGFSGVAGNTYGITWQTHASINNTRQTGLGANSVYDAHPFGGGTFFSEANAITAVGGFTTVYKYVPSYHTPIKPKHFPVFGISQYNYLKDISGPNSVINDSTTYSRCIALLANECVTGSSPGDVYFTRSTAIQNFRCFLGENYDGLADACIGHNPWLGSGTSQVLTNMPWKTRYGVFQGDIAAHPLVQNSPKAHGIEFGRLLTRHATRQMYRGMSAFDHVKPTANGRAGFTGCYSLGLTCIIKIPIERLDGVNRAEFMPVTVQVPATAGVNNVVVEFGYSEHADPSAFQCTERAEKCIAHSATIDRANPFSWASETYSGVSCATGCTVTIPAYPTRVLFYRVVYRDASNNVLWRGRMQVQTVF